PLMANGGTIYAGTTGGVYASTNSGASWTEYTAGLTSQIIQTLAAANGRLYAGAYSTSGLTGGVYVSTNNGASWTLDSAGMSQLDINALYASGDTVFAGGYGGVYRSVNDGANWTNIFNRWTVSFFKNGNSLFAGTYGGAGIFQTVDNGAHWTAANGGYSDLNTYAMTAADTFMFAASGSNVLRRNLADFTPEPVIRQTFNQINFLVSGPITGKKKVLSDTITLLNNGNAELTISGATANDTSLTVNAPASVAAFGSAPLIVTFHYNTTQKSSQQFVVIASNDPATPRDSIPVTITVEEPMAKIGHDTLVFNVNGSQKTYTDTFYITNNGNAALIIDSLLRSDTSFTLTAAADSVFIGDTSFIIVTFHYSNQQSGTSYILVQTSDPAHPFDTVYLKVNVTTGVTEGVAPAVFGLSAYPNPFSAATTIAFSLPESAPVRLTVYNALGEEVATPVNSEEMPGTHSVAFNASGLQNGTYFYRIAAGKYSQTGMMMLIK
ncbi:MAG TPA: T9SS type A sorting domain-containing protein, partial [Candidatus Kapabacteria bacterium]|nr:T9SS type A sorting domain-containing protein [Candidatus Kapabacteria bacterium]